ncbi:MAG: WD40 repeat domain-containing protein [Planctomycetes bacterium]|nr:WD40 repeat domain-containing protein [Planctomycetota bacterium]
MAATPPPPVTTVAYHPEGKILAAGTYATVTLIDTVKGEVITKIEGQNNRVTALAFSPKGETLVVASGEPGKSGQIRFYSTNSPLEPVRTVATAHKDIIYALTFSPDGSLVASAGYDRAIKLWSTNAKDEPRILSDHSDTIYALSFHHNGKLLASASADRAVKVWEIASGKRLYTLSDSTDWLYSVAWSPDGKHLAASGIDKSIRIWEANAEGGKLVHSVFAHTQPVTRLVYAKDGKTLYSISEGKNLKSWNTATMKEIFVYPPQPETMLALALSPDQKQIAVGFFDGKLKLIDANGGKTLFEPLPAKPKPPLAQKLTPNAGLRGKTIRIAFEGQNLGDVDQITADNPSVLVKIISVGRTSIRLVADVTLPTDMSAMVVNFTLKSPAGAAMPLAFSVDRYPILNETGPRDSSRIGLKVTLPATLVGTISRAGDADYYRFEAKQNQEIAVQVTATEAIAKFDPILEITDANGKVVAESANGLLGYACPTAGSYALGIRDKDFRGGQEFTYRISAGDFPLITGVAPLSIERGKEQTVALLGVNLGANRNLKMKVPADALPGTKIPVPLPKSTDKQLGDPKIVVGEFPEIPVIREEAAIAVPGTATGVLHKSNLSQLIRFTAKKGERLIIEVDARRLGSPLDSNDSVRPTIRLENWNELAIDDYLFNGGELMRIKQLPKGPDDDCQFHQVGGQRQGFLDTTPTHHFLGSAMYKVEMHPPGSTFPPNGLPVFNLAYRNDDGGATFGKDSRLFFDPPADGTYHVRIRDTRGHGGELFAYRLTVRPPNPSFTADVKPMEIEIEKGGSTSINVTANRIDGFDGPIEIELKGLPMGFESPRTFIEPGQTTTTFPLHASPEAVDPKSAKIIFSASGSYEIPIRPDASPAEKAIGRSKGMLAKIEGIKLKLIPPGDIVTTTNAQEVTIQPGKETKLLVTVERRNGFAGRIPIEVRGLPHGVRVMNIGLNGILITERDTQREIVFYAEPWVKPMEHPLIVLARQEKKKTEHGAKPVMLKVGK